MVPPTFPDHHKHIFLWKHPNAFPVVNTSNEVMRALVVGGGLTAVQAALRVVKVGHECTLCSRRASQEKHFDLGVDWFDPRTTRRELSNLCHEQYLGRLQLLQDARDGGSVPPMYMKQLRQAQQDGRLTQWVGQLEYDQEVEDTVTVLYETTRHSVNLVVGRPS